MELFGVHGHRHTFKGGNFVVIRLDVVCGDDVTEEIDAGGAEARLVEGKLMLMKA